MEQDGCTIIVLFYLIGCIVQKYRILFHLFSVQDTRKGERDWFSDALFDLEGEQQDGYGVKTVSDVKSKKIRGKKSIRT